MAWEGGGIAIADVGAAARSGRLIVTGVSMISPPTVWALMEAVHRHCPESHWQSGSDQAAECSAPDLNALMEEV